MIRNPAIICVAIAAAALCACANQKKDEAPQGYLATHIFEDGSKQFVYTVDLPDSGRSGKRGKGGGRPGNATGQVSGGSNGGLSGGVNVGTGNRKSRGQGGGQQHGRDAMLVSLLDDELKDSDFCRDGYMELDRSMEPQQTFIKGECTETASASDRENFPNESE